MNTWISLLPPLCAITLAISTRKAYIAIFSGIFVGSIILAPSLVAGLEETAKYLSLTLQSPSALKSLIFILMIGAIINLLQRSGAINHALYAIAEQKQWVRSRTHAQLLTFLAGFLMCLEGIGSMMMVGVVGRSLFKQYEISPQKLAFVANGTGAPLAWLIPVSSAGLFLTSLIQAQIDQRVIDGSAIQFVIDAIPYQFYTLLILLSVPLLSVLPHDFTHPKNMENQSVEDDFKRVEITFSLWVSMAPLYLLIVSIIFVTYLSGDVSNAIYCSGYIALVGSVCIYRTSGITLKSTLKWGVEGAIQILPAVIILALAFTFSHVIGALGTGDYLAKMLAGSIAIQFLPALIFLTGIVISFATGSSGATVSILIPIVIPMAAQMGLSIPMIIGAVVSGAVFGDQSSPISDSVIVAASAANCSSDSHFRTQLPIVLKVALIALLGFIYIGVTV
ncbi:Na+/H+ antiporter NhaC family protein [Photobacterium sp. DNB22_13_2]